MTRNMGVEIESLRRTHGKRIPLAKFLLDAFPQEGILAFYELTDAQLLARLRTFYKQSNRSNPLKGGK